MALSLNTVLEVRTGGSDTNGGGFVTGASGTDWSLQTAAQYSVTDGVTAGTTTIVSATAAFGTDVVGNLIYVQGGTGSVVAGWYQIISRTNATTIVVDRATGLTAGTGVTLKIGGALLSPGLAMAIAAVSGNIVFVKYNAAAFEASTASTGVAGGCIAGTAGVWLCGYDTTRSIGNTDPNRPTFRIQSGLSTATLFTGTGRTGVSNFILDGQNQTSSRCSSGTGSAIWQNVKVQNFNAGGINSGLCIACEFTGNSVVASCGATSTALYCVAYSNTSTPFTGTAQNCLSYSNSGASTDGFSSSAAQSVPNFTNCVAYGNGRDGFRHTGGSASNAIVNCIAEANSGIGYNVAATGTRLELINCASFNNTSGRSGTSGVPVSDVGAITGSGSFFTNAASGDFSLNNTAGAGALCRGTAFPATYPAGLTADYSDVGAAQHQDAGVNIGGPWLSPLRTQYEYLEI